MAGYKSDQMSKVVQSLYSSVKKNHSSIEFLRWDFPEPLNIITDSQFAERVVLHIKIAEFIYSW